MILFDNTTTIPGFTITDSLAYVNNCNIDSSRVTMSGEVTISLKSNEPDYTPYTSPWVFNAVPYDSSSDLSPSAQFYKYLMNQPQFLGGTQYPA